MTPNQPHGPLFARLLRGEAELDLAGIALEIASDRYPALDPARYLAQIEAWALAVARRTRPRHSLRERLSHLNAVLFEEERFHGNRNAYSDPRNSYLNEVIDRRAGIPISLSIVYLAVGTRAGIRLRGVNLPAHFVVRAGSDPDPVFVDPFHEGALLDADDCETLVAGALGSRTALPAGALEPCSTRALVARSLRNLKAIYLGAEDYASALPVLRRLVSLEPEALEERRDLGIACLHAGRPREAFQALEGYLASRPNAGDAPVAGLLLSEARRRISLQH